MKLLQSKLQPPKRPGILSRQRLIPIFDPGGHTTLITVLAGAGYGKTTLVADALSRWGNPFSWYRLDPQDTDFSVFVSYLHQMIQPAEPEDTLRFQSRTDALIDWLGRLETRIQTPFALVLDDYHLVQDSPEINRAVEFILERLPSHIRLIIIGRKNLPLALSRIRSQDRLLEISERELAFSVDEIRAFFKDGLSTSRIHRIMDATNGWAASLVLLRYAVQKQASLQVIDHLHQRGKTPPDLIFSYLKENIFDQQPTAVRQFMMKAALLPEIEADLCGRIFHFKDAGGLLNRMIEDHLLIFPVDDTGQVFYLHHLFRDFLVAQLHRTCSSEEVCRLHCGIGEALEPSDPARALYHFIEGMDFYRAVSVILDHEADFLLRGKIHFIGQQIEKLPRTCIHDNPRLLLFQSRLHAHYGEPERAIELISEAMTLFKQRNDREDMVSCVIDLASQYYVTGHPAEAMALIEQVLDDINPTSPTYMLAMTYLTFLPSVLGKFQAALDHDRAAREVISGYSAPMRDVAKALLDTSLTHTLCFQGEFKASQELCSDLLPRVRTLSVDPCLPLVYYQLSTNSFYMGDYEKGCTYARKGIDACERMTLNDSRKAWVYYAWAQNQLGLGRLDLVSDTLGAAIRHFEPVGNRWGLASAWDVQARVCLARHNTIRARSLLDKALDLIRGYGLFVTRGILKNTYAEVLIADGEDQAGLDLLLGADSDLENAHFHLFNNALLTARAQFRLGRFAGAAGSLARAFSLSMAHDYDRFIVFEKNWILSLVRAIKDRAPGSLAPNTLPYIDTLFRGELSQAPVTMTICLLGPFALGIGERKVPADAFKSRKALMLLKYLAARRCRGYIPREHLMELLWPNGDPQKTAARFNMAMSALRKILEPRIAPRAPSAYIDRKKDAYRLFDDGRVWIDAERFASLLAEGRAQEEKSRQLALLLGAVRLYRGDFLEEDPYEDWCMAHREAFLREFSAALESAIPLLEQRRETDKAMALAEKWFRIDPLNENAVRKLLSLQAGAGALSAARATFDRYARAARGDDLPVSEALYDFYRNLT